jgi:hypothetical protein
MLKQDPFLERRNDVGTRREGLIIYETMSACGLFIVLARRHFTVLQCWIYSLPILAYDLF